MILNIWNKLSKIPFGKLLFSCGLKLYVPYTGTINPKVESLAPGHAQIKMKDRRRIRNHLGSVHAIALMNIGECATGLAVMTLAGANLRAIIKHLEIDYIKKARGELTCTSTLDANFDGLVENKLFIAESKISNTAGEVVATVKAHWIVGPKAKSS